MYLYTLAILDLFFGTAKELADLLNFFKVLLSYLAILVYFLLIKFHTYNPIFCMLYLIMIFWRREV
jgi:hypothetical protein